MYEIAFNIRLYSGYSNEAKKKKAFLSRSRIQPLVQTYESEIRTFQNNYLLVPLLHINNNTTLAAPIYPTSMAKW